MSWELVLNMAALYAICGAGGWVLNKYRMSKGESDMRDYDFSRPHHPNH